MSLAELIQASYQDSDNSKRKAIETHLASLRSNFPNFCLEVMSLLSSPFPQEVKEGGILLLKNSIRDTVENGEPLESVQLAETVFTALTNPDVPLTLKYRLSECLPPILASDDSISKEIVTAFGSLHYFQWPGGLLALKAALSNSRLKVANSQWLVSLLSNVGHTIWKECTKNTSVFEVMQVWSECIKQITEMHSRKLIRKVSENSEFSELFWEIISYKIDESLFSTSQNLVAKMLNNTKNKLISALNSIIDYLIHSKRRELEKKGLYSKIISLVGVDLPDSPFVSICFNLIPLLLDSFSNNTTIEEENMVEVTIFLQKTCGESRFVHLFADFIPLTQRCIIVLSCKDYVVFEENPEEFVYESLDLTERQESSTFRTETAKLLEVLCDRIDQCLPQIVRYFISSIQSATDESAIETGFLVFSVLSYVLTRRSDLLRQIEHVLIEVGDYLHSSNSPIIHNRLCLFMYFFAESLFPNDFPQFQKWMVFLVNSVNHASKAVSIQACETLSYLLQAEELVLKIKPMIPALLPALIRLIPSNDDKNFFEMVLEVISHHPDSIVEHFEPLTTAAVHKISMDNGKKESLISIKCWAILKTIAEHPQIVNSISGFEEIVWPLYAMLEEPTRVNYEDNAVLLINSVIKATKKITPMQWKVLEFFPLIQRKQKNRLLNLFRPIIMYIIHGVQHLQENPELIQIIINMACKALNYTRKGTLKESSNAQGALIFHMLLHHLTGIIDNHLESILMQTLKRYECPRTHDFFTVRLLEVFLSALIYDCRLTMIVLGRNKNANGLTSMEYVLQNIIEKKHCFTHSYDRRLIIIGSCQIMLQDTLPDEIMPYIQFIFEAHIFVLANKEPQKTPKIDPMEEVLNKVLEAMSDEELLETEIVAKTKQIVPVKDSGEETEAIISLSALSSPIIEIDEYIYCREKMNYFHENNTAFIRQCISKLSNEQKNQLLDVLNCKRVKINEINGENTVVRKIVSTKHNQ